MRLKNLTQEQFTSALKRISVVALAECFNRQRPAVDRLIRKMPHISPARMNKTDRKAFVQRMKNNPTEMEAWLKHIVDEDKGVVKPTIPNIPEMPIDNSLDGSFEVDVDAHLESELAKLIPPIEYLNKYKNRKINGFSDFDFYDIARKNQKPILISGPTGSGKTMSFWAYAAKEKLPVLSVNCHGMTTLEAIVGTWQPSNEGFIWRDGIATKAIQQPSILIIEEINMSDETLSSIWYSLLDDRQNLVLDTKDGSVINIHPGCLRVATMNPNYLGTHPLNQALSNRFKQKLEYGYDVTVEKKLIKDFDDTELIECYYGLVTDVRDAKKHGGLETDISTRDIIDFMEDVKVFNKETAYTNFVNSFDEEERDIVDQLSVAKGLKTKINA